MFSSIILKVYDKGSKSITKKCIYINIVILQKCIDSKKYYCYELVLLNIGNKKGCNS